MEEVYVNKKLDHDYLFNIFFFFILCRKLRPKITLMLFLEIFVLSLLG